MLKNYIKIAFRNIIKNKAYSVINIAGLAIGIAAVLLILLYIQFEFSYDSFQENSDRIYRVSAQTFRQGEPEDESFVFVPPVGPELIQDFAEIEQYTRISTNRTAYISRNGKTVKIENICYADSTFFNFFTYKLTAGDPFEVLASPYSIVLTVPAALKIFGKKNPLGEQVLINNEEFTVTGIAEEPPQNSHLSFNALISFETLYRDENNYMGWNGGNQYITYIKLNEGINAASLEEKLPAFLWKRLNEQLSQINVKYGLNLQPLRELHLYHNTYSGSYRGTIYIFSVVALIILLVACINFINLTTASAAKRYKEVGVRKVLGADRPALIRQFLMETVLLSFISLLAGLFLVELVMTEYNGLTGKQFNISYLLEWRNIIGVIFVFAAAGFAAGFYPAFRLSSFQPVKIFRSAPLSGKNSGLRNFLITFQFSLSIALIICTIVIGSQINYLRNKELGFDKENILFLPLASENLKGKVHLLKNEMKKIPSVVNASASSGIPANGFTSNGYFPEGIETPMMINVVDVDEDFLETYGIKITQGRNFSSGFSTDKENYLINQTLAEMLRWNNPVGKTIRRNGIHKVIGVTGDFSYSSLHNSIEPLIITNSPWRERFSFISLKISSFDLSGTISQIKNVWNEHSDSMPFEYFFLDQTFDGIYKSELKFREIFSYFSFLAIVIALSGLFSLTACSAEAKTKEIGIRKVFGASSFRIIKDLSFGYLRLVLIGNLIAWPAAYIFLRDWLSGFAFRTEIEISIFILTGLFSILTAFLTISYRAIKAAAANPVESLRYE